MSATDQSEALLFLERGLGRLPQELGRVFGAVAVAAEDGHQTKVTGLWLPLPRRLEVDSGAGGTILADVMSQPASEKLADIEINRYLTVPEELLTERERIMRDGIGTLITQQTLAEAQLTLRTTIRSYGGIALLAGTQEALKATATRHELQR
jgi:hypothetical protein